MKMSNTGVKGGRAGFSLVELLTVIAVIAILAALLIPATGMVRDSVAKSKTRAQFSQFSVAYESFRADNGFYPTMGEESAVFPLAEANDVFIETLSGRKKDGSPATHAYAKRANKKGLVYYVFSEGDFAGSEDVHAGKIVDAFGNPNIVVVVDRNRDGVIPGSDLAGVPESERPENINAGVVFYSSNEVGNPDWEWVFSWD